MYPTYLTTSSVRDMLPVMRNSDGGRFGISRAEFEIK